MTTPGRDEAVRAAAEELETLFSELDATVKALTAILLPPEADPDSERVVTQ